MKTTVTIALFLTMLCSSEKSPAQREYSQLSNAQVCYWLVESNERLKERFERVIDDDIPIDDRFYAPFESNPRFDRRRARAPEMSTEWRTLYRTEIGILYSQIAAIEALIETVSERNPNESVEEICTDYEQAFVDANADVEAPDGWLPLEIEDRLFFVPPPVHISERLQQFRRGSDVNGE